MIFVSMLQSLRVTAGGHLRHLEDGLVLFAEPFGLLNGPQLPIDVRAAV